MHDRRRRRLAVQLMIVVAVVANHTIVSADTSYTVRRGDSITMIARTHGVPVGALLAANQLRIDSVIHPGQTLLIPTHQQATYTVRAGDGLRMIAKRLGVAVADLLAANSLRLDSVIHPGQQLKVPAATPPSSASSPRAAAALAGTPAATASSTAGSGPTRSLPREVRSQAHLVPIFEAAAREAGVPLDLLMAVGYHESRWRPDAVSSAGALGVCQVMPPTAAWVAGDLLGEPDLDPRRAADGIRIGARLLRHLLDLNGGTLDPALAMYAQGVGGVERNGISAASKRFIAEIESIRDMF